MTDTLWVLPHQRIVLIHPGFLYTDSELQKVITFHLGCLFWLFRVFSSNFAFKPWGLWDAIPQWKWNIGGNTQYPHTHARTRARWCCLGPTLPFVCPTLLGSEQTEFCHCLSVHGGAQDSQAKPSPRQSMRQPSAQKVLLLPGLSLKESQAEGFFLTGSRLFLNCPPHLRGL